MSRFGLEGDHPLVRRAEMDRAAMEACGLDIDELLAKAPPHVLASLMKAKAPGQLYNARNNTGNTANRLSKTSPAGINFQSNTFTIHCWARLSGHPAANNSATVFSRFDNTNNPSWTIDLLRNAGNTATNARFFFGPTVAGLDVVVGGNGLSLATWYSISGVKNGTGAGAGKVYLNGAQDGSITSNQVMTGSTSNPVWGGARPDTTSPMIGDFCELAAWDVVLSQGELLALASSVSPLFIRPSNLKFYVPVLGFSPEPDLGPSGNNMTVAGTLALANHAEVGRGPR